MSNDAGTIKRYLKRAEHLRAEAENMTNLESKRELPNIAANYEQLANRVSKSGKPK